MLLDGVHDDQDELGLDGSPRIRSKTDNDLTFARSKKLVKTKVFEENSRVWKYALCTYLVDGTQFCIISIQGLKNINPTDEFEAPTYSQNVSSGSSCGSKDVSPVPSFLDTPLSLSNEKKMYKLWEGDLSLVRTYLAPFGKLGIECV
tara:strand:+ start:536 stop:976 length:441 start_codon:yes stop_codon:yes gene_type:complete